MNNLIFCSQAQWRAQMGKRKRSYEETFEEAPSTFLYACIGQRLCRVAFPQLVSLNEKTVERNALTVANSGGYDCYSSNNTSAHQHRLAIQLILVYCFLSIFASEHGLECPSGRGSHDDEPLRIL